MLKTSLLSIRSLSYGFVLSSLIAALHVFGAIRFPVDYSWHADAGERLLHGVGEMSPHFLWHVLIIFIHKVSGSSFMAVSFVSVFLCVFVASLIVYCSFKIESGMSEGIAATLTFVLFFLHPVFFLYPIDKNLYLGYFSQNPFHNPTFILLKSIALLHFILFCKAIKNDDRESRGLAAYLVLGALLALTVIAKPSYFVAFVPSVVLVVVFNVAFPKYSELSPIRVMLIFSTLLPGLVVIIWQFFHFFVESGGRVSIGFGFLDTYSIYSYPWTFPFKLFGSVVFPISLIWLMGRRLARKIDFQISSIMLLTSIFYASFIVELYDEKISGDGNWIWSSQLANFMLFFVCIQYYALEIFSARRAVTRSYQLLVPALVLFLHAVAGAIWWVANIFPNVIDPFGRY